MELELELHDDDPPNNVFSDLVSIAKGLVQPRTSTHMQTLEFPRELRMKAPMVLGCV